jgi:hypothetical protein
MNAYGYLRQFIKITAALACLSIIPSKSHAAAAYAFGQGPDGRWAAQGVQGASDQQTADSLALTSCRRDPVSGSECKILARFSNSCFAIAIANNGNAYGWSYNPDRSQAVKEAAARCGSMDSCTVKQSFCEGSAASSNDENAFWDAAQRSQPCANVWKLCDHTTNGEGFYRTCLDSAKAQTMVCYAYQSRDKSAFLEAVARNKVAQNEFSSALGLDDDDADQPPSRTSSNGSGWTCFPAYPQCIRFCMQETGAEGDAGWCGGVCSEHGYSVGKPPGSHRCYHARP